jgi:hypothetical protein
MGQGSQTPVQMDNFENQGLSLITVSNDKGICIAIKRTIKNTLYFQ